MPVHVEHKPVRSGNNWAIVENATGRIQGRSTSKAKAQGSANARNASAHGWHGDKK